jgi:hypothetical protein
VERKQWKTSEEPLKNDIDKFYVNAEDIRHLIVPKKPFRGSTLIHPTCGNCKSRTVLEAGLPRPGYRYKHCPDCGQLIDWREN